MQAEENKTVDIDTSGPDTEIELNQPEDQSTDTTATESTEETSVETVATEPSQEAETTDQGTEKEAPKEAKKEELEQYSEGVQKRIAKLTKRMREAERQKEEAIRFAQTEKQRREQLQNEVGSLSEDSLTAKETSVTSGMEAAKAKLAAAREAGDMNAEVEAQQAIAQLAYAKAELDVQKKEKEKLAKQPVNQQEDIQSMPQAAKRPDPKAEAWAEKNNWFGQDSAMTYTAFDLHKKLTEDEGYDPNSEEYYSEIDKRIRLEFPHKFAKQESTESTKPVQQVASAKRSTKTGRKTVRLTSSLVAIAKKLGVPLEEYAKQLKLTKEA